MMRTNILTFSGGDIHSSNEDIELDELDIYTQLQNLVKKSGMNMLSRDEYLCALMVDDNVVAVTWGGDYGENLTWSMFVLPEYRNHGFAKIMYECSIKPIENERSEYGDSFELIAELLPPYTLEKFVKDRGYKFREKSGDFRVYYKDVNNILMEAGVPTFYPDKSEIDTDGYVTLYHGGKRLPKKLRKNEIFYMTPYYDEALDYARMRGGKVFTLKVKPEDVYWNQGSYEVEYDKGGDIIDGVIYPHKKVSSVSKISKISDTYRGFSAGDKLPKTNNIIYDIVLHDNGKAQFKLKGNKWYDADMVLKYELNSMNENNETASYIYHGTGKGQALNIQRDGYLKPNNTGEKYPSISFTNDLDYAKYYAEMKGGVILRTRLTNSFELSNRIANNNGAEYITFDKIPTSILEILTYDGWKKLDKWNVIFNEPLDNRESINNSINEAWNLYPKRPKLNVNKMGFRERAILTIQTYFKAMNATNKTKFLTHFAKLGIPRLDDESYSDDMLYKLKETAKDIRDIEKDTMYWNKRDLKEKNPTKRELKEMDSAEKWLKNEEDKANAETKAFFDDYRERGLLDEDGKIIPFEK